MQNVNSETKCKNCGHRFGFHQASGEACPDTTDENPDPNVKMFRFRTDSKFEPEVIEDYGPSWPKGDRVCKNCGGPYRIHKSDDNSCPNLKSNGGTGVGWLDGQSFEPNEWPKKFTSREGLRRIEFSRFVGNEERKKFSGSGISLPYKIFGIVGFFHHWGSSYMEEQQGIGNFSIAIVEDEEGQVWEVNPSDIKFIS